MHRDNADTVNFSRVTVADDVIEFADLPDATMCPQTVAVLYEERPCLEAPSGCVRPHPYANSSPAIVGNAAATWRTGDGPRSSFSRAARG